MREDRAWRAFRAKRNKCLLRNSFFAHLLVDFIGNIQTKHITYHRANQCVYFDRLKIATQWCVWPNNSILPCFFYGVCDATMQLPHQLHNRISATDHVIAETQSEFDVVPSLPVFSQSLSLSPCVIVYYWARRGLYMCKSQQLTQPKKKE